MSLPPAPPIHAVDSNVLLRTADPTSPMHPTAVTALAALDTAGIPLVVFPQNLIEFWRVATGPTTAKNPGLGMAPIEADARLRLILTRFALLPDREEIFGEWHRLVVAMNVSGYEVHDARLVACMLAHSVTHIVTFNLKDFRRYASVTGITVIDPASFVTSPGVP